MARTLRTPIQRRTHGGLPLAAALTVLLAASGAVPGAPAPERPANRLSGETSPYLLQHARNPVDWYPWGSEALTRARREGKPIFLSIGYAACHWCHVMERECFEDEGIARQLNDGFIAIKVDREERPDLDEIYMAAVQLISGRGGWPMSVFLTPEGRPFFGATYLPRDTFAELLRKVAETWRDPATRKQLEESAAGIARAVGQVTAPEPAGGSLSPGLLGAPAAAYLEQLDSRNGGFAPSGHPAPKFPPVGRLAALLAEHRRRPDPRARRAVTLTLDRMARGGIYDHVGGGFHRYSVDERWLVPHFEKMLYDNAQLAWVYLLAYRDLAQPEYLRVARETLAFVLRELHDPAGGFWSTLDADSGEGEGHYYVWTPREVTAALGPREGALFNRLFGVTTAGNFAHPGVRPYGRPDGRRDEGRSIPNLLARPLESWARELKTTPEQLRARTAALRQRLRTVRASRPRPPLDDKVLASWNGLTLRALALAYDLTGEETYRAAAESCARFLVERMAGPAPAGGKPIPRLVHTWRKSRRGATVFLEDYAYVLAGLLELHRATGDDRWSRTAAELARRMLADFGDPDGRRLYATPRAHEELVARPTGVQDGSTPAPLSLAAWSLVRLGRALPNAELLAAGRRLLEAQAGALRRYPGSTAALLLAAHEYFRPEVPAAEPEPRVSVTAPPPSAALRAGTAITLPVRLTVAAGWHIAAPGGGPGSGAGKGAPTATSLELLPGPFRLSGVAFPAGQSLRAAFLDRPLRVLAGEVPLRVTVVPGTGAATARALRLRLRYQACNERVCDRPVERVISIPLPGKEGDLPGAPEARR